MRGKTRPRKHLLGRTAQWTRKVAREAQRRRNLEGTKRLEEL
jgi:hypothetical protein